MTATTQMKRGRGGMVRLLEQIINMQGGVGVNLYCVHRWLGKQGFGTLGPRGLGEISAASPANSPLVS